MKEPTVAEMLRQNLRVSQAPLPLNYNRETIRILGRPYTLSSSFCVARRDSIH